MKCSLRTTTNYGASAKRARTRASWDAPAKQDSSQNDRIVVSLIMRCKNECNPSLLERGYEVRRAGLDADLFLPSSDVETYNPWPTNRSSICFPDPARPQPVDQYSSAVT